MKSLFITAPITECDLESTIVQSYFRNFIVFYSNDGECCRLAARCRASNGQQTYLDTSTVEKTGAYRTTWEKVLNQTPDADGAMYSVGHWRYNCSRRTVTLLSYILYRGDGVTLKSNQVPSYIQQAKDVAPDTVGEMMFKAVCR